MEASPASSLQLPERRIQRSGGSGSSAVALPVEPRRIAAPSSNAISEVTRRVLNVAAAAALLTLTLPAMAVIALLVKLTSPGPILYVQQRVGLDRRQRRRASAGCKRRSDGGGKPFDMYKFRTMYVTGEGERQEVWARPDDPRVTPLGRVLRRYRLDELPQLFNVLKGDMNLVGPRPEQPRIFVGLREEVDRYEERQRVRPGITGWAQVNWNYDRDVSDVAQKLAYDLEYINRRSVGEDLKIMLRTVPVIVFKRGAW